MAGGVFHPLISALRVIEGNILRLILAQSIHARPIEVTFDIGF